MNYAGYDAYGFALTFTARRKPTEKSHGHLYRSVVGPFKTAAGCKAWADAHNMGELLTQEHAENRASSRAR